MSVAPEGSGDARAETGTHNLAQALSLISGVEGWLSDEQARRLYNAAAAVSAPGRIVEIGSFRGRSTIMLACAAKAGVEVVAIDPHGGADRGPQEIAPDAERGDADFMAFNANLGRAGVQQRVRHVRSPSLQALNEVQGAIDLLYIDGAHRYGPASGDIAQWGARASAGGTMLVHDSFNAIGVTLAQCRLLVISSSWRYQGRSGSLAEYHREHLNAGDVFLNAGRQLAGMPYFVRNMLVKVLLVARLGRLTRLLGHHGGGWPY